MATINIDIDQAGNVKTKVEGYAGPRCRDVSKFLEDAIGIVIEDKPTGEFYQQETQRVSTKA